MITLETIGYYLYMEEQENRSRELKAVLEVEEASLDGNEQEKNSFPVIEPPPILHWTKPDN